MDAIKIVSAANLERQAYYLLSIACLIRDAGKHDELVGKARALFDQAANAS